MNKNLFKGTMVSRGETYEDLCMVLGIAKNTLSMKVNESLNSRGNKAEFTQDEMLILKKHWNLADREFMDIFFNDKVSK